MRNALLTLLAAALVLPAAVLAARTGPGGGALSVEGGAGVITVQARGSIFVRLERGALTITDQTPRDGYDPVVSGAQFQRRTGPGTITYGGRKVITFRLNDGSFRVQVNGAGISLTAVGQGWALLDGDGFGGLFSTAPDADCYVEPETCRPLPDQPLRVRLGGP